MKQNQYEIIVLDLDGTLTHRDKVITPRTKKALMDALREADPGGHAPGGGAGSESLRRLYPVL